MSQKKKSMLLFLVVALLLVLSLVAVFFLNSHNCPDKICQQRGMVSDTGYPVTCLPHKLVIQIERLTAASDGIDAVVQ